MKIAILSCNTGGGHNAAAAALAEELAARGHESKTYNTLDFLPKGAAGTYQPGPRFRLSLHPQAVRRRLPPGGKAPLSPAV